MAESPQELCSKVEVGLHTALPFLSTWEEGWTSRTAGLAQFKVKPPGCPKRDL